MIDATTCETRACQVCESPSGRAKHCSGRCRAKASRMADPEYRSKQRARNAAAYVRRSAVYFHDCRFCGKCFCSRSNRATRCAAIECERARNAKRAREGGWALKRNHVRKAARFGGLDGHYKPTDVYDRSEWRCALCGDDIDAQLAHPHPLSKSVDHIVPLSKGGDDTFANVQAAHLVCNMRRGNKDLALEA